MTKIFFGKEFNTQKEAEQYVRDLIMNKIGLCSSVKSTNIQLFNELLEIVKYHPSSDNKLKNMNDFKIIKNKLNNKAYELNIINLDGSILDISWKLCVTSKHKTPKQELSSALRYSIEEQIHDYKNKVNIDKCVSCNTFTNGKPHIDHVIYFEKLVNDFNTINILPIPSIFDEASDNSNRRAFTKNDIKYETAWKKFHKENAILQVLCKDCNLRREKYKIKN